MTRRIAHLAFMATTLACDGRGDDSATRRPDTSRDTLRRVQVVSATVHVETLRVAPLGRTASGADYDSALARLRLPITPAQPLKLTVADTTDGNNYQAAAEWMRGNDTSSRGRNRFTLGWERYASGVLIVRLDTLLDRHRQQSPFETTLADSVAHVGLTRAEVVADECRLAGYEPDQRVVGVLPDDTVGVWMRPRVAWFVDTIAARVRRIRPDSLACWLIPDRDR